MVLTMVMLIWRKLIKVRVEAEIAYRSYTPAVMVGHDLCRNLQSHIVMDDFLETQF